MDTLKRFADAGLIPVVVIEDAADAVPTAEALLAAVLPFVPKAALRGI